MPSKRKLKKPKDPHKPKSNPSSYFLFHHAVSSQYKEEYPDKKPTEHVKLTAAKWKTMSDAQKKPYYDKASALRKEYMLKMEEYKKTQHFKDYQKILKEWKQRCEDAENSSNDDAGQYDHKQKKKKWKDFKKRREQELDDDNDSDDKCCKNRKNNNENPKSKSNNRKDVTEWNWYSIIQWLNRIENGKFKDKKYSSIKKLWKESSIRGYELFGLNDLVLRFGGIKDNNDREIILKNICKLTQQKEENKEIISKISIMECDVPNEMCCPISFEIMEKPVLCTVSGHSYEKDIIEEYIDQKGEDPLTRQIVTKDQLVPNRALRDMIQSWKKKHIVIDE